MDNHKPEVIDFLLPSWVASPLINDDWSGTEASDEAELRHYVSRITAKWGNASFSLPSENEFEQGFKWSNDMNSMGGDTIKLLLIPSNNH